MSDRLGWNRGKCMLISSISQHYDNNFSQNNLNKNKKEKERKKKDENS